jgi:hypothetical protein
MRPEKAEKVANILIGIAATAAAYYILRDRSARRQLWQIVKTTAAASGPWLIAEARRAWVESGASSGSNVGSPDGRARAV